MPSSVITAYNYIWLTSLCCYKLCEVRVPVYRLVNLYDCTIMYYTIPVDAPMITPSFAVLFPGNEVIFSCINATSIIWSIDEIIFPSSSFPPGVSIVNDTTLRVNMSANATMYGCAIVITGGNIIRSNTATLVLAG